MGPMAVFVLILLVFAFVFLCLAARNIGEPRWKLGWLGLACYILSQLLGVFGTFGHHGLQ